MCAVLGVYGVRGSCFVSDAAVTNRFAAASDWGSGVSLESIRLRTASSRIGDLNPFDSVVRDADWGCPMNLRRDPPRGFILTFR